MTYPCFKQRPFIGRSNHLYYGNHMLLINGYTQIIKLDLPRNGCITLLNLTTSYAAITEMQPRTELTKQMMVLPPTQSGCCVVALGDVE